MTNENQLIVISDIPLMEAMAKRFMYDKELIMQAELDNPQPPDELTTLKNTWDLLKNKGHLLRLFQRNVSELVDVYHSPFLHDDLADDLIEGKEDGDVSDVITMIGEFEATNPNTEVISVIPIDFKGTVGYIVQKSVA